MLLPVGSVECVSVTISGHHRFNVSLPFLYCFPKLVIDNPQRRDLDDLPLLFGLRDGYPLPGNGIGFVLRAPINQLPDVSAVVEQPGAPSTLATECGVLPRVTSWTGYAFLVKPLCDFSRAEAGGIFMQHSPDNLSLFLNNDSLTYIADTVSVS
ncbi:MAG: hypothetical protein AAF092_13375 [Pseudomonadota bacterium]